jgi:hypothetical protein
MIDETLKQGKIGSVPLKDANFKTNTIESLNYRKVPSKECSVIDF